MSVTDFVLIGIIAIILGLAFGKIIRDKKKGVHCIGCSGCPGKCDRYEEL